MLPVNGNVNAMPRKLSCKLKIGGNTITEVKQLTYAQDWSGDISIGQVVSSYITTTIPTPSFSLTGANVSHSMGIGSPAEWVAVGTYRVDASSVRTRQGYTSFSAYDKLHDTVNTYHSSLTFPTNLQNVLNEVCSQIGITSTSLGLSFTVDEDILSGYTLRDVLGFCAAMVGKNAYLSASGGLVLKWFSATSYTADGTRANVPYIGENNCTVNRLICQAADGVLTSGSGEGIYFTCPLMTQARLDSLQAALAGLSYRKADVDIPYGNFCLQSGDIITVTTTGSNLTVPIMANSWTYDGGLSSSVGAYGVSDYSGTANNAERSISGYRVQSVLSEKQTEKKTTTIVQREVQEATNLITGASGGHIRITFDGTTGEPAEILVMDTADIRTAQNVWVFNQNGIGHFSNGYGVGTANIALTRDGFIAAERIAGQKISGVRFENNPNTDGQEPQILIEDGAVTVKRVTVNDGEVVSTTDIGDISYISRSQADGTDSLAIRVDSGKTVTIGMPNDAEFVYYSDTSQAPSGAEKFNFFGNIRFYSNLIGDFVDLAALERRVYDLEHPT